jgi:hypothetical protein
MSLWGDDLVSAAIARTGKQIPHREVAAYPAAATLTYKGYIPNNHVATIHFRTDDGFELGTVVHEVTHAAIVVYSMDATSKGDKANKHLTPGNELLPHLIDELFIKVLVKLGDRGLDMVRQ